MLPTQPLNRLRLVGLTEPTTKLTCVGGEPALLDEVAGELWVLVPEAEPPRDHRLRGRVVPMWEWWGRGAR